MIDRVMSALLRTDSMKVSPGKPVDKIQQQPFILGGKMPGETSDAVKTPGAKNLPQPEAAPANRQDELSYVPLPLRSQIYEDARFYYKLRDFSAKTEENGEVKVLFSIHTDLLGQLWFTLTAQPGKLLSVQCITENNEAAEAFRAASTALQEELSEVGYPSVILSCRTQPGIRGIADLDPDFPAAEAHFLLNVQV
ncbi:flagellar hook-length control protein FliK [Desulforamulus ruminis]|uniref:flagellar hook-length control protein FliK n=1 Tax=Desulforamulus ruminis TaxID=1564 RepID=UPI002FD8E87A